MLSTYLEKVEKSIEDFSCFSISLVPGRVNVKTDYKLAQNTREHLHLFLQVKYVPPT